MSKYIAYPEYKDSGVDWLDQVPSSWKVKRISYVALLKSGDAIVSDQIKPEEKYPVFGGNGLRGYTNKFNHCGEYILIGRQGAHCGNIHYAKNEFWASEHAVVVHPLVDLNFKWFGETLRAMNLNQYNVSAAQPGLAVNNITCLKIPFPSLKEQTQIANFLDHETAKIDTLIDKQQQLIKLLKEKRQAVISHAVTKGLNANAPMKDSGVEWLGEVPEHWDVCLFKYKCSEVTDGAHISPETNGGEHYFVSIRDIKDGVINFDGALLTSPSSYQYLVKTGCMPFEGDVLFSKDGTIGQTAITPSQIEFVVASSLIIIRPDRAKVTPEFLDFILQSSLVKEQVESFVKGAALRRLSIQNLLKVFGVFPQIDEQIEIVAYIQSQLVKFQELEIQANKQVALLRERRTALISSAVTGKIDVRNWQAPENQEQQQEVACE